MNWFWVFTGAKNEAGWAYGLWSGFGGSVPDFVLLGGFVTLYRRLNCGSKGCWRIGLHEYEMDGVTHKLCRKCHPAIDHRHRLTREHFARHHAEK